METKQSKCKHGNEKRVSAIIFYLEYWETLHMALDS